VVGGRNAKEGPEETVGVTWNENELFGCSISVGFCPKELVI